MSIFPPYNMLLWKITDVPNIGDNSIIDPQVLSIQCCQLIADYVSSFTPPLPQLDNFEVNPDIVIHSYLF